MPLRIKGASWFGMETEVCVIGGADARPVDTITEWLASHDFNAIRLPLAADAILHPTGHPCTLRGDQEGKRRHNLAFGGLTYMKQVEYIVRAAADSGLLVLLDLHVLRAGVWPDGGNVASSQRQDLFAAWEMLATELCDADTFWNVMGADLKNEPYTMFWGDPGPNASPRHYSPADRWDTLASELGRRVIARCPRWSVFVQGVGECRVVPDPKAPGTPLPCSLPSAPGHQDMTLPAGIWWGENLQNAAAFPIDVGESRTGIGKVVYSPHTYGPTTAPQRQFEASSFPNNMPNIWDVMWAHLARENVAPVIIGEFGGLCTGSDRTLQAALVMFMQERTIGGFWWSINPESADTGGLVVDWESAQPESIKLTLLSSLPATRVPKESSLHATPDDAGRPPATARYVGAPVPPPRPPLPPPSKPPPPRAMALEVIQIGSERNYFRWPPPSPSPPPQGWSTQWSTTKSGEESGSSAFLSSAGTLWVLLLVAVGVTRALRQPPPKTAPGGQLADKSGKRMKSKIRPKPNRAWQPVPAVPSELGMEPGAGIVTVASEMDMEVGPAVSATIKASSLSGIAAVMAAAEAATQAALKLSNASTRVQMSEDQIHRSRSASPEAYTSETGPASSANRPRPALELSMDE